MLICYYSSNYSDYSSGISGWLIFFCIVLIAAAIFQIVLSFKVWDMTDDVNNIKTKLGGKDPYELILAGEKAEAARILKQGMVTKLIRQYNTYNDSQSQTQTVRHNGYQYGNNANNQFNKDDILKVIGEYIERYKSLFAEYDLGELPEHLQSVDSFLNFASKLKASLPDY